MPKWTVEQSSAINETGKNIIVSAGAGSGKTAVLSERVLTHLKNKISITDLLILTFTNAAASEMKDRIRKKVKNIPELRGELDKIDIAFITTFDAFSLSLVKRYKEYLNISSNIKIIDNSIIALKKKEFLNEIFDELYLNNNTLFLKLLSDLTLKDDKDIFNGILNLNNKLDNIYNKEEILNNYISKFYQIDNLENIFNEYFKLINKKIKEISNQINNLSIYVNLLIL